jgi:hypothetical protein
MMELYTIKKNGVFFPAYDSDYEQAQKIKDGECTKFSTKRVRNPQHHKKFFALLKLIVENHDRINTVDQALIEMKLRCGWYDLHVTLKGASLYVPRSISFDNMGQDKFNELYNQAVTETCNYFLQGVTSEQVEREILNFM